MNNLMSQLMQQPITECCIASFVNPAISKAGKLYVSTNVRTHEVNFIVRHSTKVSHATDKFSDILAATEFYNKLQS